MAEFERNLCFEAFTNLCEKLDNDPLLSVTEAQYWIFEQGYRAAMESLIQIAEQGKQTQPFTSPKLQLLAELILKAKH